MKYLLSLLVCLATVTLCRAQLTTSFKTELAQRDNGYAKVLADSVGMTAKDVKALWQVRDRFLDESSTLLADTSVTDAAKEKKLAGLRQAFTKQLQSALGADLYNRYLAYVQRRMRAHGKAGKPLAGE